MMYRMEQWGPSNQSDGQRTGRRWLMVLAGLVALWFLSHAPASVSNDLIGLVFIALVGYAALRAGRYLGLLPLQPRVRSQNAAGGFDPLSEVRDRAWHAGGGAYLGVDRRKLPVFSRAGRATLLLGPPRSGKTSGVIVPAVISHTGPVVCTSTKPDLYRATRRPRDVDGQVWMFNPAGAPPDDSEVAMELRWSPIPGAASWDEALLTARALTVNVGAQTTDRSHWATRAQARLAPMLHAAAVHGKNMETVVEWVSGHDLDQAGVLLEDDRCSKLAFGNLLGILKTEGRERSSIFSAASDALAAYNSERALQASKDPNFDPARFVQSKDTIYIHASGEQQAVVAPVVCGLLSAIRRATYQAHSTGQLPFRVLFALDEVANIAPIEELPQIASEGGGQGLLLLAALQDLSQARARWGQQADGFLTLFGDKLILPGVADRRTLEAISTMLGEYDRQMVAHTRSTPSFLDAVLGGGGPSQRSSTYQTQRTPILSPGEIANIPAGNVLHLDGVKWQLLTLTPAHRVEPWRTLSGS